MVSIPDIRTASGSPKLRKYFVSSQLDLLVLDFGTTSMIQLRDPKILSNLGMHIRIISCKIIFKFNVVHILA